MYNSQNAFANEGFIDELAQKAGTDPYQFRLNLLKNAPRHLGVLRLAAEKADWGKKMAKRQGMGIALHESFGSWAAHVAEVTVTKTGELSIDKICLLYTSPSPRDRQKSRMPSSA